MKRIHQNNLSIEQRIVRTFMAGGLLLFLSILLFVPPSDLPFTCIFHSVTGHSCLTCGMTRSLHAMMHGDWIASFRYHLFGPAVFVGMLLCFIVFTVEAIRGKHLAVDAGRNVRKRAFIMLAVVWIVYWGSRLVAECAS
jgi:hypothetical protein